MLLSLQNVTTGYGKAQVLGDISLQVDKGEIVALLGANGAGKTTTLRSIVGELKPWRGSIALDGRNLAPFATYQIIAMGIAYSPEGRGVFANLSVYENLRAGAYLVRSDRDFKAQLDRVYTLFPRLRERQSQLSGLLSGGEQQMLAIGRALMTTPKLFLLDEPSLGLAPILVQEIYKRVKEFNTAMGIAVLLVEQNVDLALEVSAHAYVLQKGRVQLAGISAELREDEALKASYLGIR